MKNIKKFENFNNNTGVLNYSEVEDHWSPRRILNQKNGIFPYVQIDKNIEENKKKKKGNKNVDLYWERKDKFNSSDKVLFMTEERSKELNNIYTTHKEAKKKYSELINKYKVPTAMFSTNRVW